ncbi:MAG TPA: pitrilysin family protein, partial [Bacteroidales bacterium]|nr:pitrilysin family protein [Bacteroidales bacterium]
SLAIQYHVGSNRESKGHTGFAHLFEHMMFQQSENVGEDQFFRIIQNAGGTLNGGTGKDGTVYYEVVPKNSLEKVLWLESDRMGYLLNTVTKNAFANQQNVVQNEKRQSYDNQPYGFTRYVIDKNLYPDGHPYSWQIIGEMEDLQHATIVDVKNFHENFYVPNNATLVLAGDFNTADAKTLIEKYFGEIPSGKKVTDMKPMNISLNQTKRIYYEDNFARAPRLTMVWPTINEYTKDSYALEFLGEILADGKKAPLYKVLVKDKNLTSRTSAYNYSQELAGQFNITITANSGVNLSDVEAGINDAFALFEKEGVSEKDIARIKAKLETRFYNGLNSVLYKSFQLARYNEYAGDPGFIEQDIANLKAVTKEDVMDVYNRYIKNKPFVLTSFVPKGHTELNAANCVNADIQEENINDALEVKTDKLAEASAEIEKTPTSFDRSNEPAAGPDPEITVPAVWKEKLPNGLKVYGIEHTELPLVSFSIILDGGHLLDDMSKPGVANLVTDLMMEGTRTRTPEELEEDIDLLGSSVNMYTSDEYIKINVNCLSRNYDSTLALVQEILLDPRWDIEEFERAKIKTLNNLKQRQGNPYYLASKTFRKLNYGNEHILSTMAAGTPESVNSITIDDLKNYYAANFSPSIASFQIAGNISKEDVMNSLASLSENWAAKEVAIPETKPADPPEKSSIVFVDMPGAKQSVINIGCLSIPKTNDEYYAATVMNDKLGGSFNGILNLILREEKGFTYGARSYFDGTKRYGEFVASSAVRSNSTLESVEIFKDEMEKYRNGISDEDLNFTKNSLIKSNARKFETLYSLVGMLEDMSAYNLPSDYIKKREEIVKNMTPERHKELAQKYLPTDHMYYIVVGDAATQMSQLE